MRQAYRSVELTVVAVQWDGDNYDEIVDFIGSDNVVHVDGEFQVRISGGRWENLSPGWWITRHSDGDIHVASPGAFARLFTPF